MNRPLSSLLEPLASIQCLGADIHSQAIQDITIDSRKASSGVLFAAIQGTQVDGHDFIPQAIAQGCRAILCSEKPSEINPDCCYIQCTDVRETLGKI
jgi:UDP-N-acetylmuramoyl-L-alanyl-D-glutamate--2,6-diaminopimelate ligase